MATASKNLIAQFRGLSFDMFGVHFRGAAKVVVAANNVKGRKRHAPHRPAQILTKFCVLRVASLTCHNDGALAEAASIGKEHRANLCQGLEWINPGCLQEVAIGPVVIARSQYERMF